MARIKGTGFDIVRRLVKSRGADFERKYLEKLPDVDRKKWETVLPVSWWDVTDGPGFIDVASEMFYPGDPRAFHKMAKRMAQEGLSGIYKIFLRIPTMGFVIQRAAKMWRTYQDTGTASIEDVTARGATFVVTDYPDMPAWFRNYLCGYIDGLAELTGITKTRIEKIENDPTTWKWKITW